MLKSYLPLYVLIGRFLLPTSVFSQTISIEPYYEDERRPFVFDSVNNRGDAYRYPYKRATSMTEGSHVKKEDCNRMRSGVHDA